MSPEDRVRELEAQVRSLEEQLEAYQRLFTVLADSCRRLGSSGLDPEVVRLGLQGLVEGRLVPAEEPRAPGERPREARLVAVPPFPEASVEVFHFDRSVITEKALARVRRGDLTGAVTLYRQIVDRDPKDVRVWIRAADLEARLGHRDAAIEAYLKAADLYGEQGFYLKAVAVYKQITRLDPDLVEVNRRLAELFQKLGLLADAMAQYEIMAATLTRLGRTQESLDALRRIVALDPADLALRFRLVDAYLAADARADAVAELSTMLDLARQADPARRQDLLRAARRLLDLQPENVELGCELAELYLTEGHPAEAVPVLQFCFRLDPREPAIKRLLGRTFEALGQRHNAISVYEELARAYEATGNAAGFEEIRAKLRELRGGTPSPR